VTHNLSEGKTHEPRPYLRGSVRRASGFVLTGKPFLTRKVRFADKSEGARLAVRPQHRLGVSTQGFEPARSLANS
jgi:hypothetical protein